MSQALAQQGYAVLRPTYPDSLLTARFLETAEQPGRRRSQTDLSDGVSYLAAQGIIDPKRVCIAGSGSYAAMQRSQVWRSSPAFTAVPSLTRASQISRNSSCTSTSAFTVATGTGRYLSTIRRTQSSVGSSPIKHIDAIGAPGAAHPRRQ